MTGYQRSTSTDWHKPFLAILPKIESALRTSFRDLKGDSRDEAVQEGLVHALVAYRRLANCGKTDLAYPSVLARHAAARFRDGRRVAERLNINDATSRHCQNRKGVHVRQLDRYDGEEDCWREIVVEDRSVGPADIAAMRIDFAEWLATLPKRERRIAETLAMGERTGAAAKKHGVSPGRISQVRRQLKAAWQAFHDGDAEAATT